MHTSRSRPWHGYWPHTLAIVAVVLGLLYAFGLLAVAAYLFVIWFVLYGVFARLRIDAARNDQARDYYARRPRR